MPPAALSVTYCTPDDLTALLSAEGVLGRADDDADGGTLSDAEAALLVTACSYGTAQVNSFLLPQYASADLAGDWLVNEWATLCAARWACVRRGNGVPASIKEMYDEAVKSLREVRSGAIELSGVALRDSAWPAWSNVTVEPGYFTRRIRVERQISDPGSTQGVYQQAADYPSAFYPER